VVSIEEVPDALKPRHPRREDERFYEHRHRLCRRAGARPTPTSSPAAAARGASTITMQVARNFSSPRRKRPPASCTKCFLAFKIEHSLTKDQILELYVNQIYLGQRAYGFAAAAQIYFGKSPTS